MNEYTLNRFLKKSEKIGCYNSFCILERTKQGFKYFHTDFDRDEYSDVYFILDDYFNRLNKKRDLKLEAIFRRDLKKYLPNY